MEYRILNFIIVFAAILNFVKCKQCNENIKFQTASAASDLKSYYYVINASLNIFLRALLLDIHMK